MSTDRRKFLRTLAGAIGLAGGAPFYATAGGQRFLDVLQRQQGASARQLAGDESFWRQVKLAYSVSPSILNLNNGGVSPQPVVVQEAVERYNRMSNELPTFYMWRVLDKGREPLRSKLATLAGCSPDEIAINRNASEALETVIFGLQLKAGDEVVLTRQDYPNMINAWKQRAHRDGIVLKWLSFDFPIEDDGAIVEAFTSAFTPRTKVVHITHVINWNGQVLPARKIALEARRRGIEALVDGAHSFCQLDFEISGLECDYFGTSLHKWLCAPFGSGMLYVRQEKIAALYPLFGAPEPESGDIRKFENLGTRSFAIEQAIGQAIDFHLMIGTNRKQERLQYLKNYWVRQAEKIPGFQLHSPSSPPHGCGIALFSLQEVGNQELSEWLFRNHQIHTVSIEWEKISGIRVTPNVYTLTEDLDRLVHALQDYVENRR
ncbi:MAG: aminotransferase class V-fold PLP-dependent enzyme [Phaeodactylibacter sp.]|nr:aminotransferase class V-fold PLP-dependent enzyme [Phaeodactylibacter sp.]MCB9050727.1 aminotransferase class V-fold PLP-dependent enzyme [Lewinellaceae bacterium]